MTINLTKYNALIHRAITKIAPPNSYSRLRTLLLALPIAAVALFAASALSACSKEVLGAPIEDMEYFYGESLGLKSVAGDSIQRFATKVETYVYKNPEERKNPYYPEIVDNIKDAAQAGNIVITITIETEWEGVIEISY
jgi:hypothetical protein